MQFQLNEIHYARYDYLNYCRYVLIDMVNYAEKNKSTTTTIPFKNDNDKEIFPHNVDCSIGHRSM